MDNETTQDEIKNRFEEARRRIRAEAEEKLRALDISETIINNTYAQNGSGEVLSSGSQILNRVGYSSSAGQPTEGTKRLRVTPEVKKAISEAEEEFSQQDISEIIERKYPDANVHRGSVSNAIARMLSRGERIDGYSIELAEKGGGSTPKLYRKVKDTYSAEKQETNDGTVQEISTEKESKSVKEGDIEVVEEDFNEQDFDDIPF